MPEASWARTSPPRDDVGATALAPLLYASGRCLLEYIIGTQGERGLHYLAENVSRSTLNERKRERERQLLHLNSNKERKKEGEGKSFILSERDFFLIATEFIY